jgi:hypothetical protein
VLRFDPFYSDYDVNGGWLYAELAIPGASYTISLYDPASSSGSPFRTFSGTTTSGLIDVPWDGAKSDGTAYSGASANAVFEVTPDGAAPETHTQPLTRNPYSYAPDGDFTMTYISDFEYNHSMRYAEDGAVQLGAVDPLLNPSSSGFPEPAYGSSWNEPSDGGFGGDAGYVETQGIVPLLLRNLGETPTFNFYFEGGHGNSDTLGNNIPDGVTGAIVIRRTDVARALGNGIVPETATFVRTQPYRLVFLNACDTADNPDWARAFGIFARISYDQLVHSSRGAQALAGWDGVGWAPFEASLWDDYMLTIAFIFFGWMEGQDLKWCLERAQHEYPFAPDLTQRLPFPLGGGERYSWLGAKLKIYGYEYIKRTGYNPPHP